MIGALASRLAQPVRGAARAFRLTRRSAALVPQVLEAILVIPRLSEQLEVIALQTATLVDMEAEIARVRADTAALPPIDAKLERVAALLGSVDSNTAAVEQLAEVLLPLQGAASRVGRMADRLPERRRPQVSGASS